MTAWKDYERPDSPERRAFKTLNVKSNKQTDGLNTYVLLLFAIVIYLYIYLR